MKRTYWTSEKSLKYAMNKIKFMKNVKRIVSITKKNGGYNITVDMRQLEGEETKNDFKRN